MGFVIFGQNLAIFLIEMQKKQTYIGIFIALMSVCTTTAKWVELNQDNSKSHRALSRDCCALLCSEDWQGEEIMGKKQGKKVGKKFSSKKIYDCECNCDKGGDREGGKIGESKEKGKKRGKKGGKGGKKVGKKGDDVDDYVSPVTSPVHDSNGIEGMSGGKKGKGERAPLTVEELLTVAETRIREAITNNPFIAPTFLRLAFHDCAPNGAAGGCDGCINLSHEENAGLLPAIQALSGIVADLENPALGVSRADIWAFATLVAAEASQFEITFTDKFQVGRENCETVGTCDSSTTDCAVNGPDQITDFPSPESTTHELLTYMQDHFNFNPDETVAIMGAHTMGRALPQNSGYEGQFGWVANPLSLDNEYYLSLVGPPPNLEEGPDWIQIQVKSGEHQWIPSSQGDDTPNFMLNVDIAMVRDLGIQNNSEPSGFATCTFRFPPATMCPLAATLSKAGVYRENNLEWLNDFKKVLNRMISKGL